MDDNVNESLTPTTASTDKESEGSPKELTAEELELLDQALGNLQEFIKDGSTHYAFLEDTEPTEAELEAIEKEEQWP
jgi:hypothetical protein